MLPFKCILPLIFSQFQDKEINNASLESSLLLFPFQFVLKFHAYDFCVIMESLSSNGYKWLLF